jgi:hypothetical protein
MRKSRTHSARALGKKSAGKRGGHQWRAHAPTIALCALGAGILAATTYGLTQRVPEASVNAQAPGIAAAKDSKAIAGTASANPAIAEQATKKEDRLVTGSLSTKQGEIAPPKADTNVTPQVEKKKKPGTATAKIETPKTLFDLFNNGQQKR